MKFLLDTCVVSETIAPKPSESVLSWFASAADDELYLSAITVGEILHGILLLPESRRRTAYLNWFHNDIEQEFAGRILSYDRETAEVWAAITAKAEQCGHPRPLADSLIAATAVRHGMTLVTRNVSDMEFTGADVFNPWGGR